MIHKLQYFKKSQNGICADDFSNKKMTDIINTNFILSVSELQKFHTPFSDRFVANYSLVTMSNDDKYYIDEMAFLQLSAVISASAGNGA